MPPPPPEKFSADALDCCMTISHQEKVRIQQNYQNLAAVMSFKVSTTVNTDRIVELQQSGVLKPVGDGGDISPQ